MIEQEEFQAKFAAERRLKIKEACRRKQMWLRVRHGIKPDSAIDDTLTEVYLLTEPRGNGIHFFSIVETGQENRNAMVVENKRLINRKLEDQIRQFLKRHYSQLANTQVNFIRKEPKRTQS